MPNTKVKCVLAVAVTVAFGASPATAAAAGECPVGDDTKDVSVTQDVTVANTISDNHSETHSDNGGLSRNGGKISLGTSNARSKAEQGGRNRQGLRVRRRDSGSKRRQADAVARAEQRCTRKRTATVRQTAALSNWLHNNSAATSANTGESAEGGATLTGATDSDVVSTQLTSNDQSIDID